MNIEINHGSFDDLLTIEEAIPEFVSPRTRADLEARLTDKTYLLLVAYVDKKPVGYKLGYELEEGRFYSWLGAVLPEYRGNGIAKQLLYTQESWCRDERYSSIEVKSMNQFKSMLLMLISNDYKISEFRQVNGLLGGKIRFMKHL